MVVATQGKERLDASIYTYTDIHLCAHSYKSHNKQASPLSTPHKITKSNVEGATARSQPIKYGGFIILGRKCPTAMHASSGREITMCDVRLSSTSR